MRRQALRSILMWMFFVAPLASQELQVSPSFSHPRGFYQTPFTLVISGNAPDVQIAYTRDGSDPSRSPTAATVPSPATLTVDPFDTLGRDRAPCVVIRACAVKGGIPLTGTATHTYLFPDQAEQLSPDGKKPGPGWPEPRTGVKFYLQGMDYGLDPEVLHDPRYQGRLKESLLSVPTLSLVTDLKNLFDSTSGIYVNSLFDGREWERPVSVELINPDGSAGFQIDAGLRIRGAWGRSGINLKHSFRLFFRKEYGQAKLRYPLFGDEGVTEFDALDLRTSQNYSWGFYANGGERYTELREVFSRDTQRDMGQPYTRTRYYHLYLNATYWGLYQTQERSEASFGESYLGGKKEDYDVVKVDIGTLPDQVDYRVAATDGDLAAYQRLWECATAGFSSDENYYRVQGRNQDGSRNPAYPVLVDIDNLIDYMLCTDYVADPDGPTAGGVVNNFYAMRNRNGDRGFVFFRHDAEHSLMDPALNTVNWMSVGQQFKDFNPRWLHHRLCAHPDYRLRLADHIRRHFFNGGSLTAAACRDRILKRMAQMEGAVLAESARWGDADAAAPAQSLPRTKDGDWLPEVNRLLDQIIAVRTDTTLNQLKAERLYAECDPPVFSLGGGIVPTGSLLSMSAGHGAVYYTLDGNDARLPSALRNVAETLLVPRNARKRIQVPGGNSKWNSDLSYNDSTWALCENSPGGIGYDLGSTFTGQIAFDLKDRMYGVNSSCQIRIPFEVTQEQLSDFNFMNLRVQYSGGWVAYLNNFKLPKTAVASRNFVGSVQWNSKATAAHDGKMVDTIDISASLAKLVAGHNLLAVQAMSTAAGDSSFFFSVELAAGNIMRLSGPVSPSAILYTSPVVVDRTMQVKARVYADEQWSAPAEASFRVSEGWGNLEITELHYHPLAGAGTDGDRYEFIELRNIGAGPLDLGGTVFIEGVDYVFPAGARIEAGAYLVLASDAQAFETRYGFSPYGQYTGHLSNSGEAVTYASASGDMAVRLNYGTRFPWPGSPDGSGKSLVRRQDRWVLDVNDPSAWCASASMHGHPGKGDDSSSELKQGETDAAEFRLHQNFPNPFNASTEIRYTVPGTGHIRITVFDLLGREVAVLKDGIESAGSHAARFEAAFLASGIYLVRLETSDGFRSRKLLLMR